MGAIFQSPCISHIVTNWEDVDEDDGEDTARLQENCKKYKYSQSIQNLVLYSGYSFIFQGRV